ncbi:hypothetical protein Tco_1004515 [Tanacetum coccineum]|uniref:Uncharacterized protein n=1 Tax=Tanacetum coccineum TaxID=301880 RepID=A0ABQ5FEF7_9ASTR
MDVILRVRNTARSNMGMYSRCMSIEATNRSCVLSVEDVVKAIYTSMTLYWMSRGCDFIRVMRGSVVDVGGMGRDSLTVMRLLSVIQVLGAASRVESDLLSQLGGSMCRGMRTILCDVVGEGRVYVSTESVTGYTRETSDTVCCTKGVIRGGDVVTNLDYTVALLIWRTVMGHTALGGGGVLLRAFMEVWGWFEWCHDVVWADDGKTVMVGWLRWSDLHGGGVAGRLGDRIVFYGDTVYCIRKGFTEIHGGDGWDVLSVYDVPEDGVFG